MFSLKFELTNFFLIGLPECFTLTMLALAILKQEFKNKIPTIILISFIVAFGVLAFRSANLNIGLHTTFATLTLALLVSYFFKTSKLQSLIASIICLLNLSFVEYLVFFLYKYVLSMDINDIAQIKYHWFISNWLHIIALAFVAFLINQSAWYQQSAFFIKPSKEI